MNKFKQGQTVIYNNRKWIITGSGTDGNGNAVYYLRRGCYRTTANEEELTE